MKTPKKILIYILTGSYLSIPLDYFNEKYYGQWGNSPVLQQLAAKWEGKSDDYAEIGISANYRGFHLDLLERQRKWFLDTNIKVEN